MINWRLSIEVTAFICNGEDSVYLASPEKTKYEAEVLKLFKGKGFYKINLSENEFALKICESDDIDPFELLIKHKELPEPNKWYCVKNFDITQIGKIIQQLDCIKGEFSDIFEAVFAEDRPQNVSFISNSMKEYLDCFEELERRVNCQLLKKTKKWIPGHKYNTEDDTRIYLCPVVSRKINELNTDFNSDLDVIDGYLYVNRLEKSDKTISEVLKSRCFGKGFYDLKVDYKIKPMVDTGEVLINDCPDDISSLWDDMLITAENNCKSVNKFGLVIYKDYKKMLDIFAFQSKDHISYNLSEESLNKIKDLLNNIIYSGLIKNWNFDKIRTDIVVNSSNSKETNIKSCEKLTYSIINDDNILKTQYYKKLFDSIGIKFTDLVSDIINSWKGDLEFSTNFDKYCKYIEYFKLRNKPIYLMQRSKSILASGSKPKIETVEDKYSDGELKAAILNLINYAENNYGLGVSSFNVYNIGSKTKPIEYVSCKIDLMDLLNFYKDSISENLKKEIVDFRFCDISIQYDKGSIVQ